MRKHEKINVIIADEGMLLTQSENVPIEERFFSSRVYDNDLSNWQECTLEYAEQIIAQRDKIEQGDTEIENNIVTQ